MHVLPALLALLAAPPTQPSFHHARSAALLTKGDAAGTLAEVSAALETDELDATARIAVLELGRRASAMLKDVEGEARFALLLDAARRPNMPVEARRYSRSRVTQRACEAYETIAGPGSCAQLARDVTGEYNFQDHSRVAPRKELSSFDIESAHAQYLPALRECVSEAAHADRQTELFDGADITIAWAIDRTGRVVDVEIKPSRYEAPLGACVRERLGWFRYPQSLDPARKVVSVPYSID